MKNMVNYSSMYRIDLISITHLLSESGEDLTTGIYFGWALLSGEYHRMVVSVGWNPYYKNERKTVEAHLFATLNDFYGETLSVLLCGYLRNERGFNSLGTWIILSYLPLHIYSLFSLVIQIYSIVLLTYDCR